MSDVADLAQLLARGLRDRVALSVFIATCAHRRASRSVY
jgi:hypothetical protein